MLGHVLTKEDLANCKWPIIQLLVLLLLYLASLGNYVTIFGNHCYPLGPFLPIDPLKQHFNSPPVRLDFLSLPHSG